MLNLENAEVSQFSRQLLLRSFTFDTQLTLKGTHICIPSQPESLGLYLAASGIGKISVTAAQEPNSYLQALSQLYPHGAFSFVKDCDSNADIEIVNVQKLQNDANHIQTFLDKKYLIEKCDSTLRIQIENLADFSSGVVGALIAIHHLLSRKPQSAIRN